VVVNGKVRKALCRCGHSGHKPMCDRTHRTVGFRAEKAQLKVIGQVEPGGAVGERLHLFVESGPT
jgi:CDGSH-type Zn-finger protein